MKITLRLNFAYASGFRINLSNPRATILYNSLLREGYTQRSQDVVLRHLFHKLDPGQGGVVARPPLRKE